MSQSEYWEISRTNTFSGDKEKLRKIINAIDCEECADIFDDLRDSNKFGFVINGSFYGIRFDKEGNLIDAKDTENEDYDYVDKMDGEERFKGFLKLLQTVVAEDDAIIMMGIGYEDTSFVSGGVNVITRDSIERMTLDEWGTKVARIKLNNPDWKFTS